MVKKNWRVIVYTAIAAMVLTGGLAGYLTSRTTASVLYPTYFAYTPEELDYVLWAQTRGRRSMICSSGRTSYSTS